MALTMGMERGGFRVEGEAEGAHFGGDFVEDGGEAGVGVGGGGGSAAHAVVEEVAHGGGVGDAFEDHFGAA